MALIVNQLDYSPIYQGINAEYTGKAAKKQRDLNNMGFAADLVNAAVDIGTAIYNKVQEGEVAKAKLDMRNFEQEAARRTRDAVLNRTFEFRDTGSGSANYSPLTEAAQSEAGITTPREKSIHMPQDYEDWYKGEVATLEKKYQAYPTVSEWAKEQAHSIYSQAKEGALASIYNQSIADQGKNEQQLITTALEDSIKRGDPRFFRAAIASAKSLSPEARATTLALAEEQYAFGMSNKGVREATAEGGYLEGNKAVAALEEKGEITKEQADELRKQVLQTNSETAAAYQQAAAQEFYAGMAKEGADAELEYKKAIAKVPLAWAPTVEKQLRAEWEEKKAQANDTSNREMLVFHDANPNDGQALLDKLRLPENAYAKKMSVDSYRSWENLGLAIVDSQKVDAKVPTTPDNLMGLAEDIWSDNRTLPRDKINRMQALFEATRNEDGTSPWDPKDQTAVLTWAGDPDRVNQDILDGWEVIKSTVKIGMTADELKKEGLRPGLTQGKALVAYQAAIKTLYGRGKEPTLTEIFGKVESILKDGKDLVMNKNQKLDLSSRSSANQYYAWILGGGTYETEKDRTDLRDYMAETFVQVYDLDAKKVTAGFDPMDNSLPAFKVEGSEIKRIKPDAPVDPKTYYWFRFTSDEKGNLSLMAIDRNKEGKDNWRAYPLPTKAERDKVTTAKSQAAQEAAAEALIPNLKPPGGSPIPKPPSAGQAFRGAAGETPPAGNQLTVPAAMAASVDIGRKAKNGKISVTEINAIAKKYEVDPDDIRGLLPSLGITE
jgi:hypothetical protein